NHFISYLNDAAQQISQLLERTDETPETHRATQDAIVSFGELLSSALFATLLKHRGVNAEQVDPRHCIITNDEHTCAAPLIYETFAETRQSLLPFIEAKTIPVVGGFVGATTNGNTTPLGRGGSDYTAALLGAALGSKEIQIWTDVTGVLTADPRVVPNAQTI